LENIWGYTRVHLYEYRRWLEMQGGGTYHPLSVLSYAVCFPQTSSLDSPFIWAYPSGSSNRFLPCKVGHCTHRLSLRLWRAIMECGTVMNTMKFVQLWTRYCIADSVFLRLCFHTLLLGFCVHHTDGDGVVNSTNLYSVIFYSTRWKKFDSIWCENHNVQTSCRCENLKFVLVIKVNSSLIRIKLHDEISTQNLTTNISIIYVTFIYFALKIWSLNLVTCHNHAYEILTSKFSMPLTISLHCMEH